MNIAVASEIAPQSDIEQYNQTANIDDNDGLTDYEAKLAKFVDDPTAMSIAAILLQDDASDTFSLAELSKIMNKNGMGNEDINTAINNLLAAGIIQISNFKDNDEPSFRVVDPETYVDMIPASDIDVEEDEHGFDEDNPDDAIYLEELTKDFYHKY